MKFEQLLPEILLIWGGGEGVGGGGGWRGSEAKKEKISPAILFSTVFKTATLVPERS